MDPVSRLALTALILSGAPVAQESAPTPQQIDATTLLKKAIKKMSSLNSVRFKTTEIQDAASTRQIMKQMAGLGGGMFPGAEDKVVRGALSDGILHAKTNDGDDEIAVYRGRMVARSDSDDSEWKLRRNRLYDGSPMPFLLDPQLFFEALAQVPKSELKVRRIDHQDTTRGPRIVLSITLRDDAANDFALAGTLPAMATGFGGMFAKLGAMGGAGGPPDMTVDLALVVDPNTALVHKVRTASYQAGGLPGGRVVLGGAPGGFGGEDDEDEDEDEEQVVKTRDAQGNRLYKRGLPVRKLRDSLSKMQFNISFTKHGQPYVFELDATGRKLLRLPTSK